MKRLRHRQRSRFDLLMDCKAAVLDRLTTAMTERASYPWPRWEAHERDVMADAANLWAARNGIDRRITVVDIEGFEGRAVGHVDYSDKIALYVAEWILA